MKRKREGKRNFSEKEGGMVFSSRSRFARAGMVQEQAQEQAQATRSGLLIKREKSGRWLWAASVLAEKRGVTGTMRAGQQRKRRCRQ